MGTQPDKAEIELLAALFNASQYVEVVARARDMVQCFPASGFAWGALGVALDQMGRSEEALTPLQNAAALLPDDAQVHANLGNCLGNLGRLQASEASLRRALALAPASAAAHCNLGATLHDLGRLQEAATCYASALRINPALADAHYNLGNTLKGMGLPAEAEACFRCALTLRPEYAQAYANLAIVLRDQGRLPEAESACRQALRIMPNLANACLTLSLVLRDGFRLTEAEAAARMSIQLKPDTPSAYNSLGCIQQKAGRLQESATSFREALRLDEGDSEAHSNLIFTLDMMEEMGTQELQAERRCWDRMHGQGLRQSEGYANSREAGRRLRIGYVSADFRDHSAAKVFGGMLMAYDREQFEVYAYSNHARKEDWLSERLKQNVSVWRDVHALTDEELAERIRGDGIDILVDLSGYTAGNRLLVFARKPAPIQISAWGYATSTGLSAMDVFFTDEVMVPPQEREYYTEEVRYLPSVVGYCPFEPYPDVNALPALTTGRITFGSFNRLAKATEATYRAWVEILRAVPGSRLLLKTVELRDEAVRAGVLERFLRAGIEAERIVLHGNTTWRGHVGMFNEVDIALDPFPHGGGVTALEGLMMGVPLVTLRWPTVVGRLSASIMTTLGMQDWIAESVEAYVRLACAKAGDVGGLAELRSGLRGRFMGTVLGDQAAYARAVEQEYRSLWTRWCAREMSPR